MADLNNEKLVNYLVVLDKPGRQYTTESDNRWGGLLHPAPGENPSKDSNGLRIVLFASWDYGYLVFESLKEFEHKYPGKINLVGLVTDNPLNPDAKISIKKRVWKFSDLPHRVFDETFTIESALSDGIPVYTGEIKIESFYRCLEQWNPDAIIVCVFGQLINSRIINIPPYGIYNFHPSDLKNNQGAGPAPYEDLVARNAETTVWSVHHISEEIDCGPVIGQSPPMNIRNMEGKIPENPYVVYQKFAEALPILTVLLAEELSRKFKRKEPGPVEHFDFNILIPDEVKQLLMQPIVSDAPSDNLPIPEKSFISNVAK